MKTYLVTLRNAVNSEVVALTNAPNETEAKKKALLTAHQTGENSNSFLNTEFKATAVEEWDPKKSRVLSGIKRFGAIIVSPLVVAEELITGTAGIKSALTQLLRNLKLQANLIFIVDVDEYKKPQQKQESQEQQPKHPLKNYSPIRREFIVGDHYLVVSNTLPETNKKEFYCYYDWLRDKGGFLGAPVSQCGTPEEVLGRLCRAKDLAEQYLKKHINSGDYPDDIVQNDKKRIQTYSKFIEVLSDPETYKPVDIQSYNGILEQVTNDVKTAAKRYKDFKDNPKNMYSKELGLLRDDLKRVMSTHPRVVTEYREDGTPIVEVLSGNRVL